MVAITAPANPYMFPQDVQDRLITFCLTTQNMAFAQIDLRSRFAYIDKEYIRENNYANQQSNQSKGANVAGDKRKIQDIVIPVVEPQCDTALSYLTSVFLTGTPIFGVVADKANMDGARQFEALIEDASNKGSWVREFMMFFRDGLKYNFHAIEATWCVEKNYSLKVDASFSATEQKPTETIWAGNKIKRVDPYNSIFDPRIPMTEQHKKAECVGYLELHNRVSLSQFLQSLSYRMNVSKAFESSPRTYAGVGSLYYIPEVFTENMQGARVNGLINWDTWASGGKTEDVRMRFKNMYIVGVRYIRLIPKDFSMAVPNRGQVQIWKLITVNDQVVVYIERMTNAHDYLPIIFGQPIEDGLNLQTKSFAQKLIPMQDIASALANSKFAARRRLVADRGLYDPSRIREADINSDNPSAKIPVRPTAYGQELSKAYYQIPFKDEQTGTLMGDVREVVSYANELVGQNKAQQGQFVKGNRTKTEYEDVTGKSSGRQQMMALNIEHGIMNVVKNILKLNILQYQQSASAYSATQKKDYNIDPKKLRETAMVFKISDGLVPAEKLIEGETLTAAFQVIANSPQLSQEYNSSDIFAYLMKTKGADIDQFKFTPQEKEANQKAQMQLMAAQGLAKNAQPAPETPGAIPSGA